MADVGHLGDLHQGRILGRRDDAGRRGGAAVDIQGAGITNLAGDRIGQQGVRHRDRQRWDGDAVHRGGPIQTGLDGVDTRRVVGPGVELARHTGDVGGAVAIGVYGQHARPGSAAAREGEEQLVAATYGQRGIVSPEIGGRPGDLAGLAGHRRAALLDRGRGQGPGPQGHLAVEHRVAGLRDHAARHGDGLGGGPAVAGDARRADHRGHREGDGEGPPVDGAGDGRTVRLLVAQGDGRAADARAVDAARRQGADQQAVGLADRTQGGEVIGLVAQGRLGRQQVDINHAVGIEIQAHLPGAGVLHLQLGQHRMDSRIGLGDHLHFRQAVGRAGLGLSQGLPGRHLPDADLDGIAVVGPHLPGGVTTLDVAEGQGQHHRRAGHGAADLETAGMAGGDLGGAEGQAQMRILLEAMGGIPLITQARGLGDGPRLHADEVVAARHPLEGVSGPAASGGLVGARPLEGGDSPGRGGGAGTQRHRLDAAVEADGGGGRCGGIGQLGHPLEGADGRLAGRQAREARKPDQQQAGTSSAESTCMQHQAPPGSTPCGIKFNDPPLGAGQVWQGCDLMQGVVRVCGGGGV